MDVSVFLKKVILNNVIDYEMPFTANSLNIFISEEELTKHSRLLKKWNKQFNDMSDNDINGHLIELILLKHNNSILDNDVKYSDLIYKENEKYLTGLEIKTVAYFYKDNSWVKSLYKNIQNHLDHLIESKNSNGKYFRYIDGYIHIFIVFKQYKKENLKNRDFYVNDINDVEYAYLGTLCLKDVDFIINPKLNWCKYEISKCTLDDIWDNLRYMVSEFNENLKKE